MLCSGAESSAAVCLGGIPALFIIVKYGWNRKFCGLWWFSAYWKFILQIQSSKKSVLFLSPIAFSYHSDFCTSEVCAWELWSWVWSSLCNSLWSFVVSIKGLKGKEPQLCLKCHGWPRQKVGDMSDSFIATWVRWSFLVGRESGKHFLQKLLCVNNVSQEFRGATRLKTDLASSVLLPLATQWLQALQKMFSSIYQKFPLQVNFRHLFSYRQRLLMSQLRSRGILMLILLSVCSSTLCKCYCAASSSRYEYNVCWFWEKCINYVKDWAQPKHQKHL